VVRNRVGLHRKMHAIDTQAQRILEKSPMKLYAVALVQHEFSMEW
jgi:hypothetical protein